MTILLIRPATNYSRRYLGKSMLPPYSLMMLAAVTPANESIRIIDEYIEQVPINDEIELAGITIPTTSHALKAYALADRLRENGVYVVLGGMHVSVLPEEAGKHADTLICGEAEDTWPAFIRDFRIGQAKPIYYPLKRRSLQGLPYPRRDLIARNKYICPDPIQATRGCTRGCLYCSVSSFHDRTFRYRPVDEVIDELQSIRSKIVPILDDNLFGDIDYAKELMAALIPLKIKWGSQVPIELFRNKEILRLATMSGCSAVFTGLESVSSDSLNEVLRMRHEKTLLQSIIKEMLTCGIRPLAHFIFGFDHDEHDVFQHTCEYADEVGLPFVQFHILTPYPGTPLYTSMLAEGRLLNYDWSSYDARHVVFQPAKMTPIQLQDGFNTAWKRFYQGSSIAARWRRESLSTCGDVLLSIAYRHWVVPHITRLDG